MTGGRCALLFAAVLVALLWAAPVAHARPGGGQSFTGGSANSGGGGDSFSGGSNFGGGVDGDSYDGGGDGGALFSLIVSEPIIGIPIAVIIIAFLILAKQKNDGLGDWDSGDTIAAPEPPPALEQLRTLDEQFSPALFEDFMYALYAHAHTARADRQSLRQLAPYLTEAARSSLAARTPADQPVTGVIVGSMRVTWLSLPEQPVAPSGEPTFVNIGLEFETNMTAGAADAAQTFYVLERWTLSRAATATSRPPELARSLNCPNCNAVFESADDMTCSYCSEAVANGRFDWMVTEIRLLSQEARPPTLTGHAPERGTDLMTVYHPKVRGRLQELGADDPAFALESFAQRLTLIFTELNQAWNTLDLRRARPFVSDGIYGYLSYWTNAYREQGLVNRVEGAQITNWVPVKVIRDAHFTALTVRIWGTGCDYTAVQATDKVVGGSRTRPREYTEYWTLIRGAGTRGVARSDKQCPNCAAELAINMGGSCEFCHAHVTSGEFDWVLSRIEQDEAYTG